MDKFDTTLGPSDFNSTATSPNKEYLDYCRQVAMLTLDPMSDPLKDFEPSEDWTSSDFTTKI